MGKRETRAYWEARLADEGMPSELPQVKPRPRVDREWASHFGGASPRHHAQTDAIARMRLDMSTTQDLWAMLEDIRWGRHDPTIPGLTGREREVFEPYCDGLPETEIAKRLGISQSSVSVRLRRIIDRFTVAKPRLARGVRPACKSACKPPRVCSKCGLRRAK